MRINALLSGLSPVAVRGGENPSPLSGGAAGSARQDNGSADVFVQGQPWKNMATASPAATAGARPCGCKTCPACAAQAYAEQAGVKKDVPVPAVAAAEQEEKRAEPSGVRGEIKSAPVSKGQETAGQETAEPVKEKPQAATGPKSADGEVLTQAERLQVAELEMIDTKVRAHEMAHLAAAGSYATGGANFQYAQGPDGKQYAVGGEVGIDTGKESSPEATISKMQTVRAAALAPADPSPQDQKVAARASLVITEASQELQMVRLEQTKGKAEGKAIPEAGSAGASPSATGEKGAVSEDQPGKEEPSGQEPPPKGQNPAAAIMAGLMRPPARFHIAV
ncbi:MAG: putative metalloprotease CJM1_0395 family protein [Desulfurivibrionaceae bacterium]